MPIDDRCHAQMFFGGTFSPMQPRVSRLSTRYNGSFSRSQEQTLRQQAIIDSCSSGRFRRYLIVADRAAGIDLCLLY